MSWHDDFYAECASRVELAPILGELRTLLLLPEILIAVFPDRAYAEQDQLKEDERDAAKALSQVAHVLESAERRLQKHRATRLDDSRRRLIEETLEWLRTRRLLFKQRAEEATETGSYRTPDQFKIYLDVLEMYLHQVRGERSWVLIESLLVCAAQVSGRTSFERDSEDLRKQICNLRQEYPDFHEEAIAILEEQLLKSPLRPEVKAGK